MAGEDGNRSRLGGLGRKLFQDLGRPKETPPRSPPATPTMGRAGGHDLDQAVLDEMDEWEVPTQAHNVPATPAPIPVYAAPPEPLRKSSLPPGFSPFAAPPKLPTPPPVVRPRSAASAFMPTDPATLEEAGLEPSLVEQILLRTLLGSGTASGRQISRDICLSQALINSVLDGLRTRMLVQHKGATPTGDFIWTLTDAGRDKGVECRKLSLYVGPAPVPLEQYLDGVRLQTIADVRPGQVDIDRAFEDLVVNHEILAQIGPALASGRGLFLYGHPGNGKTSLAERITTAFGGTVWMPQALVVDGMIINLFDPATHILADRTGEPPTRLDRRWVLIRRPTVVAGGELTLEMLDVKYNAVTGVCEAPLQLKANCGSLVIDDFGRQQVEPARLLNRWIVPLERRVDYLRMPNGRKLTMPFDVLLIFSTNLQPRDLVDEAFLRRIPYKIYIPDPTEDEFRILLACTATDFSVTVPDEGVWEWLIETWYRKPRRPFRFCHPRDLLLQVVNICRFEARPSIADQETVDRGARMYFAL